jgi:hypothetical protein
MPDSRASGDTPLGWGEAFAALPLQAPPTDTWTSIARRLPHQQPGLRRGRRPYWFAAAAAIALAAVIPVFRWAGHDAPLAPDSVATAPTAPISPSSPPSKAPAIATNEPHSIAPLPLAENSASSISATTTSTAAPQVDKTAIAKVRSSRPSDSADRAMAAAEQHSQLESLYAESARLEAILAQLQEPRAASAPAAALSAELQDHIADIDGALSQSDMPPTSQLDLWQQRVDALRQLTGVETTQRWMAAQGTATEGPLAQVY